MGPADGDLSRTEYEAVTEYAAIAAALCDASHVMLLQVAPSGSWHLVFHQGAGRIPADAETMARAHPGHGDDGEPVFATVAGCESCGVALRDRAGGVTALFCVLRAGRFADPLRVAMRALGRRLAACLDRQSWGSLLAEAMTELAWQCDAQGEVLWCNRAFAETLPEGAARNSFLRRCGSAAGGEALVPVDRGAWFATRLAASPDGATARLGLAVDVTERILGRPGPQDQGAALLTLDRVAPAIAERIGGLLRPGLTPRFRLDAAEVTIRCDPLAFESALLDAALACAGAEHPAALTVSLAAGTGAEEAVLTLTAGGAMPGPDELPMLRRLLLACGGRAERALPGELRVVLPLQRRRRPAPAPTEAPARILVVDDEAVVRMLVVDLLRERGHAVQEAEDAFAAMALVQQGAPLDLMITDIGLPGGFDGSTLARRTRQLRPELPILFITGYAFGTNNDVILEPGIPVLTKPFTLGALALRIAGLLGSRVDSASGPADASESAS